MAESRPFTSTSDDWRLTVSLEEPADSLFLRRLGEIHIASALRKRLDAGAIVTHGAGQIYVYLASESVARATEELSRELLGDEGHDATTVIERWHPVEQRWEPPDVPMPRTEEEIAAEHSLQQAAEAKTAQALHHAEWEVVVELESHAGAVAAADALEESGLPVLRRWSYLIVGTATEDEAEALAERLRGELEPNAAISVRPSGGMLLEVLPPSPLLVFAGLVSHRGRKSSGGG